MENNHKEVEKIQRIHANFIRNGLVEETANKINELVDAVNKLNELSFIESERISAAKDERERIKEIIGKHNARILNEFQHQGTPDMPFIAYDERVCLIPAITKATEETFSDLTKDSSK